MKILNNMLVVAFLLVITSGCATVTRGTKDVLVVESEPPGADIRLSTGITGNTPASFKLPRKTALTVKIEKEGYEPVEVNVTPHITGAGGAGMAGNVLVGGLIGAAVDAGTGSMYSLKPNPIKVKLLKIEPDPEKTAEKSASDRLKELEALKAKAVITEEEYLQKIKDILNNTPAKQRLVLIDDLKSKGIITETYYQECREKCLSEL